MRLKELWIKGYKNLKDITINFELGQGLTMLVGNNGSGKSNILEVISGIFHDAYKGPDQRKLECEYCLTYELNDKVLQIKRINQKLHFWVDGDVVSRNTFINPTDPHVPNNVIGVYSGEEDRLWTEFYEPYYKEYIQRIKNDLPVRPMRLMLINKYYWSIALLTLLIFESDTTRDFIKNELGIDSVDSIRLGFNIGRYTTSDNAPLKAFIKRTNPDLKGELCLSVEELRARWLPVVPVSSDGYVMATSDGFVVATSGFTERELFDFLVQSFMPKGSKMLSSIEISINNGITSDKLSEGEKKLILIRAILEIVADEKTLLLFDEPDAYLHENRKETLYRLLKGYNNRQCIITTHSPYLTNAAKSQELCVIKSENQSALIVDSSKVEAIKYLTGNRLDFFSDRPILLFEGKSDIILVRKAFDHFHNDVDGYGDKNLAFDVYSCGGSGNVKFFYDNIKEKFPERIIVVCFDRDHGGQDGINDFSLPDITFNRLSGSRYLKHDNDYFCLLPLCDGLSGNFAIEDYLSKEFLNSYLMILNQRITYKSFSSMPKIKNEIKEYIGNETTEFPPEELLRFKPLIDLLLDIQDAILLGTS